MSFEKPFMISFVVKFSIMRRAGGDRYGRYNVPDKSGLRLSHALEKENPAPV